MSGLPVCQLNKVTTGIFTDGTAKNTLACSFQLSSFQGNLSVDDVGLHSKKHMVSCIVTRTTSQQRLYCSWFALCTMFMMSSSQNMGA